MRLLGRTTLLLGGLVILLTGSLTAQEYRGRVQGLITDASEAVVVGASVTLRNVNTGVAMAKQTNETGHYLFDLLEPGMYSVSAELTGFAKIVQDNVRVTSYGDVTVNLVLKPGATTDTITVTGNAENVQFNSSRVATTVDSHLLDNLPQVYRNPFLLAQLDPSVEPDNGYAEVLPYHSWGSNRFSTGGGGLYGNNIQVDGSQVTVGVKTGYVPAPGVVQEVNIQQNPVDAEYGHSSGGSVNITLKSGTNEWHGNGFYQGQYPWANALEDRHYRTVNQGRIHMYGGTLGNPIKKNKIFNFFSYEQWKQTSPSAIAYTMPTAAEKQGDFSQSLNAYGDLRAIYDPWTTQTAPDGTVTRQAFAGNRVPSTRINKIASLYLPDVWEPNGPGVGPDHANNYSASSPVNIDYRNISDRIDWNVSDKLRVFGRYSVLRTPVTGANPTGSKLYLSGDGSQRDGSNYAGDVVYTVSPNTVLDVHGEFHSFVDAAVFPGDISGEGGWSKYWTDSNWYESLFPKGQPVFIPRMSMKKGLWNTTANLGEGMGFWNQRPDGNSVDIKLAHQHGSHYLKWGAQTIASRNNDYSNSAPGFGFYSDLTASTYVNPNLGESGDSWATFMLGALESQGWNWIGDTEFPISCVSKIQNRFYGAFMNDDWKVSRRLTLNLGLRYEYEGAFTDPEDRLARALDLDSPIPEMQQTPPQVPSALKQYYNDSWILNGAFQFTDSSNRHAFNAGKGVLLPRAGAAFRVNDKTALRAAWGRYVSPWTQVSSRTTDQGPTSYSGYAYPGFSSVSYTLNPLNGVPRTTVEQPFSASFPLSEPVGKSLGRYTLLGDTYTWSYPDRPKQYSDRFSLSLQRQLPLNAVLDVTYYFNWTHNTMGYNTRDVNAMDPRLSYKYGAALNTVVENPFYNYLTPDKFPGPLRYSEQVTLASLMVPYPQYGSLIVEEYPGGEMRYQALQLKLEKSFSHGFSLLFGYNYHYENDTIFYDDIATYLRQWTWDSALGSRHRISSAGTWALPVGRGRQLLSGAPRLLDAVVGGWNVSGVLSWRSGDHLGFGTMQVTGDPLKDIPAGSYFNPAVFSVQPAYTPRSNPRQYGGLVGPGLFNLDSSLTKDFAITEKARFELRMDAFNALNNFTKEDVDMNLGDSTFGQSVAQHAATFGRRLQLGMKVIF